MGRAIIIPLHTVAWQRLIGTIPGVRWRRLQRPGCLPLCGVWSNPRHFPPEARVVVDTLYSMQAFTGQRCATDFSTTGQVEKTVILIYLIATQHLTRSSNFPNRTFIRLLHGTPGGEARDDKTLGHSHLLSPQASF